MYGVVALHLEYTSWGYTQFSYRSGGCFAYWWSIGGRGVVDRLSMNQGGVVYGMMNRGMMDWSMMDWSMMDWVVDRAGMVDGGMANTEISLLSETVFCARLVSRDWLLHHLHLHLQVVSCCHERQRDHQQRYEELLAISLH